HHQLHEVAEVEGRSGRVEPAVGRDGATVQGSAQLALVRGLGHQPAPLQLLEDVAHVYLWSLVLVVRVQRAPSCPVLTNASTTAWSGPVPSRPATKWRGGTVDRHGRVSLDPEPPGVCGALPARSADPHA